MLANVGEPVISLFESVAPVVLAEASLGSWQIGAVAFGFVVGFMLLGLVLERWVVGLHA